MQPKFGVSKKPTLLHSLKQALTTAMQEGQYILIVNFEAGPIEARYNSNGQKVSVLLGQRNEKDQLHPDLYHLIKDYPDKGLVWKMKDSGAKEILNHLKSEDISFSKIFVTGINSCACVTDTVRKLSEKSNGNFLIEVSTSCCSCLCCNSIRSPYNSIDEICTKFNIPNLQLYNYVITDNKKNPLKIALVSQTLSDAKEILSRYERWVSIALEKNDREDLVEMKRDILLSLFYLKSNNHIKSEFFNILEQLLHTIQNEMPLVAFTPSAVKEELRLIKLKKKIEALQPKPEVKPSENIYRWFTIDKVCFTLMAAGAMYLVNQEHKIF